MSELEARLALVDRWNHIVGAPGAGVRRRGDTPEDIYLLAGRIMKDPEVSRLQMQPEFQIRHNSAFDTDWPRLFAAMGPDGLAALRERVRVGFPISNPADEAAQRWKNRAKS